MLNKAYKRMKIQNTENWLNIKNIYCRTYPQSDRRNKLSLNQTIDEWFPTIDNANKVQSNTYSTTEATSQSSGQNRAFKPTYQADNRRKMIEIIKESGSDLPPTLKWLIVIQIIYYLLVFSKNL